MRSFKIEPIKDTIRAVIQSWDAELKSGKNNPEILLKQILSKEESRHTRANYFRQGVLGVNVDSSSWLYHLGLKKEELLMRLRAQGAAAKDIRFYIGDTDGKEKNKIRKNRRRADAAGSQR